VNSSTQNQALAGVAVPVPDRPRPRARMARRNGARQAAASVPVVLNRDEVLRCWRVSRGP